MTASTTIPNTAITGLGTMSTQNANSVAITGGAIDGATVGATTASTVRGTTITATSQFSGPGTGLTGTASSLSIGGNAATATTSTNVSGGSVNATTGTFSGLIKADGGTIQVGSSAGTYRQFRYDGTISSDGSNFYTLLNSSNYTSYSPSLTGSGASGTWGINITGNAATATNVNSTQPNIGYSASGQNIDYAAQGGPQVQSQGGGAAMMSFHRPGAYAINFGLGTDNQLRTGGWSRGGNYVILDSGNFNATINRGYYNRETNNGTMVSGQTYGIYTGGGAINMYLPTPANSAQGDTIKIVNLLNSWSTGQPFTVLMNGSTQIMGLAENMTCNTSVGGFTLTCNYNDGTARWSVTS